MIKQDLYVPTEYEFCANHGFICIQCCHYSPVCNSCGKVKITTSTTVQEKKTQDELMFKKDLWKPTEDAFCVNYPFKCEECRHHDLCVHSWYKNCKKAKSFADKVRLEDKLILNTVNDYKKAFDTLAKQGHGDKEVLFGYDSDVVYTGGYKLRNIRIKKDTIKFNEYPEELG